MNSVLGANNYSNHERGKGGNLALDADLDEASGTPRDSRRPVQAPSWAATLPYSCDICAPSIPHHGRHHVLLAYQQSALLIITRAVTGFYNEHAAVQLCFSQSGMFNPVPEDEQMYHRPNLPTAHIPKSCSEPPLLPLQSKIK